MRICLIASEILGAHKNGGIGTATSHAALFFRECGHDVKIVYTGVSRIDYGHPWTRKYQQHAIEVIHLTWEDVRVSPYWMRETTAVFEHLRADKYDVLIFQDWDGAGFSSIVARHAGIAFHDTRIAILAHGPTAWLMEANRSPARHIETLARMHMEEVSFSLADAVVCPSEYMLHWLQGRASLRLRETDAIPLYLWSDPGTDASLRSTTTLQRVQRIVFFGRLERRKGIDLFLSALQAMDSPDSDFELVFLGKEASVDVEGVRAALVSKRPVLASRSHFYTEMDYSQALIYLSQNECLAVIPSLVDNAPCVISECLRLQIPFISTMTGGIPELIHPDDRERVLVAPEAGALARRLAEAIGAPFAPARAAHEEGDVAARWRDWLDHQTVRRRPERDGAKRKLGIGTNDATVAVIVTHYERPKLVLQTLESLAWQTATDFEVVLVDDGSRSDEARRALIDIERRVWPFKLSLVRQDNRYLGAARNAGLRATDAGRVVFMDDDNLAFPEMVATMSRVMTETGADIVTSQMLIFSAEHEMPDLALLSRGDRFTFTGGPALLGLSVNCFGDATGMYSREVFRRIGGFHEVYGVGYEDWHFHVRAALAGFTTVSLPIPLLWYRHLRTGMHATGDAFKNHKMIWDVFEDNLPPALKGLIGFSVRNEFMETC